MISGTNTDYDCVQHVGSLHQYKSAATSAEWAHVVAEHSTNLWHSSIAFREVFLSQGSKKSENRNIFNVGCVNRPVMCANNKIRLHIPDNCRNWMRNYTEIHRKERLAIPRKQSQLGQFRYTMPPRPIFPGKSCLPMPKSTVWLDALQNPNCTALLHLPGVGWAPDRLWPPHYPPKIANCFPKRHNVRTTLAACLLLRFIFWTQHSSVLVLPVPFKGNTKKGEYGPKPTTGKQSHTCHTSYRWHFL